MQKKINPNFPQKLLLANPRGYCAGVKRAINLLDNLIKKYPDKTIYCYHQIVHNSYVVNNFEKRGIKFINEIDEVPEKNILVFSSHGISPKVRRDAENKQLKTIDATCPYVTKTHNEIIKFAKDGNKIIYIGQRNHDEAIGTTGEAPNNTIIVESINELENLKMNSREDVALVTQTTLSFDESKNLIHALEKKFPKLIKPKLSDICSATQNRQNGVKELVKKGAKIVVVLGSKNSSNSNKLRMVAERFGAKAYLLDDISEIDPKILENISCVGLTAGASLPENKITKAINWFKRNGVKNIDEIIVAKENIIFPEVDL